MKYLVHFDFGLRNAYGEAYEVLTEDELKMVKSFTGSDKEVYLGEIGGKHSEVYGTLESNDWKIISENQDDIEAFGRLVGNNIGAFMMTEKIRESLEIQ